MPENILPGTNTDMMSGLNQLSGLATQGIGATPLLPDPSTYQGSAQFGIAQLMQNLFGPSGTGAATPGVTGYSGTLPGGSPEATALASLMSLPNYIGAPSTGPNVQESQGLDYLNAALMNLGGASTGMNAPEQEALYNLQQITGMPYALGSAPWTQEAIRQLENQYRTETLPTIQNQMGLAGLGNSSALGDAIARARTGVAGQTSQLIQNEMNQRLAATQPLMQLGQTLASRPGQQAQTMASATQPLFNLGQTLFQRPLQQAQVTLPGIAELANIGGAQAGRELQQTGMEATAGLQAAQQLAGMGETAAAREQIPFNRFMQSIQAMLPILTQQDQIQTANRNNLIQQLTGMGAVERGIAQQMSDAQLNELARQMNLSSYSIWGPFGQIMPQTIGREGQESGYGFGLSK